MLRLTDSSNQIIKLDILKFRSPNLMTWEAVASLDPYLLTGLMITLSCKWKENISENSKRKILNEAIIFDMYGRYSFSGPDPDPVWSVETDSSRPKRYLNKRKNCRELTQLVCHSVRAPNSYSEGREFESPTWTWTRHSDNIEDLLQPSIKWWKEHVLKSSAALQFSPGNSG